MALTMDQMMYMNHGTGKQINIKFSKEASIANRLILKGEELREIYQDYVQHQWFEDLAKELGCKTCNSFLDELQK